MCDHCGCRELGPIAELTADHERILELAWRVAETAGTGGSQCEAARVDLLALLDVHAAKEEAGLYPLLVGMGELSQEWCDALEEEHRMFHDVISRGEFDRRKHYELAAHTEEEEMELFPAARFAFDDIDWGDMDRAHHAAVHRFGVTHSHVPDDHPDRTDPVATSTRSALPGD